ncbi:uncharacterized protein LOC144148597 [Haemaphysalis longicornis]
MKKTGQKGADSKGPTKRDGAAPDLTPSDSDAAVGASSSGDGDMPASTKTAPESDAPCFNTRSRIKAAARRVALALLLLEESEYESSSSSSDSSSEDSSSDDDCMEGAYERAFEVFFRVPAKRPKVVGFIVTVVRQYSDAEERHILIQFRRHFRMSRAAVSKLILGFAAFPLWPSSGHSGVPAKSAECHIVTFIWYAANKTNVRALGSRFDLFESTVHRILLRVANYIVSLGPTTLTFPTDLEKLSKDFETVSVLHANCS